MLLTINPMCFLIDAYRRVLMFGEPYDLQHLGTLAVVCVLGILLAHVIYGRLSRTIAAWTL